MSGITGYSHPLQQFPNYFTLPPQAPNPQVLAHLLRTTPLGTIEEEIELMSACASRVQILQSQMNRLHESTRSIAPQMTQILVPEDTQALPLAPREFERETYTPTRKRGRRPSAPEDRRCDQCGTEDTPEWRKGPKGPKTLCNACGLQYSKRVRLEEQAQKPLRDHKISLLLNSPDDPNR